MSRRRQSKRYRRTSRSRRAIQLGDEAGAALPLQVDRKKIAPWLLIGGGILLVIGVGAGATVAVYNVFKDRREFVTTLWNALGAFPQLSRMTKLIIIAQAAHESGWGKGKAAKEGYNYWNITAGSSWKGDVIGGGDLECDAAGQNCKPITQKFRKYRSNVNAIEEYLKFLSGGRYKVAFDALMQGDIVAFVTQLRAAGYYTAALDSYIAGSKSALTAVTQFV